MIAKRAVSRSAALALVSIVLLAGKATPSPASGAEPAKPAPAPAAAGPLKATRVACAGTECQVAAGLLGSAATDQTITLLIENDGDAPVTLGAASLEAV